MNNQERINKLIELKTVTKPEGKTLLRMMEKPQDLTTQELNIIRDRLKTYIRLSEDNQNKKVLYLGLLGVLNQIVTKREEFKQYVEIQRAEINKL